MSKILSIEVGSTFTKIVEMDYKAKQPRIYKYLTVNTPEGVFDDGYLKNIEEFGATLKKELASAGMRTKQAVCTITSGKIANREILIPAVKLTQVETVIKANASEYFPIDLSQYELGHLVLESVTGDDGVPKLKVMAMACEKELIKCYETLCEKAGLHLISADYSGNSVFQMMKREVKEDTEMILRIEEHNTVATIISGQTIKMQRNLAYGLDNCIETMIASNVFEPKTYADSIKEFNRVTNIKLALSENTVMVEREEERELSEKAKKAIEELTDSLGPLVGNVSRVLDLYNSKNIENPIKRVVLVGIGSEISGLSKLFTNELGVKTVMCEHLNSITWTQVMGEGQSGEYVTALGAGLEPVGFINEEKKKNDLKDVNYQNVTVLSIILFLLIIACMVVFSVMPYKEALATNQNLKAQEQKYKEGEVVYNHYTKVTKLYKEVLAAYDLTESNNDNLLNFLGEIEEKMPVDAVVTDFVSDNTSASLTIRAKDMEQAAAIIQIMRKFDSVMDVSIGNVDQEEVNKVNEENEKIEQAKKDGDEEALDEIETYFVFNIICTYYPNGATKAN